MEALLKTAGAFSMSHSMTSDFPAMSANSRPGSDERMRVAGSDIISK